jgi:hypothetical protein
MRAARGTDSLTIDECRLLILDCEAYMPPSSVRVLLTKMAISSSHSMTVAEITGSATSPFFAMIFSQIIVSRSSLSEICKIRQPIFQLLRSYIFQIQNPQSSIINRQPDRPRGRSSRSTSNFQKALAASLPASKSWRARKKQRRLGAVLDRSERDVPRRGEGAGGAPESILEPLQHQQETSPVLIR